ncbi:PilC/PilY family type IV pilus protein [Lysobacter sp. TY2-98]|uniref:pilus assembly protein n=1 Tax=Lysobacter sp. TY2-98 TaxID=2290922 RepID=UPI0013B3B421|nr:PilC/PilY family type IV pilus protein [Lysobacter sp. TY2-98]
MKNTFEAVLPRGINAAIAGALAVLVAAPIAGAASFPQYPLLTGGNAIPPNILLILDDSGSMAFPKMPEDKSALSDNPSDRSYVNNTLYYNPANDYLPWRTSSTDLNDRLADADFRSVASSATSPTASTIDLRDQTESYFYYPIVANPGTTASNYDKYRIGTSGSGYNGGAVQKLVRSDVDNGNFSANSNSYSNCINVNVNVGDSVTVSTSGNRNHYLYVYRNAGCTNANLIIQDESNSSAQSDTFVATTSTVSFWIYRSGANKVDATWAVTATGWRNATPTGRSQQDELQNFANWYQYHRTRNKMAKAGASEAFGRLGKNYRVGFDTIWNRNASGNSIGVTGSAPAYPIPYASNNGLFEDSGTSAMNRSTFYSRLQGAIASDGTPLHGALQRAGRYFATDNPWKDSDGAMLTCRQNYAILTTDGYWNQKDGFNGSSLATYSNGATAGNGSGNVDGTAGYPYQDNIAYTLADVAYYYWKNDLRTGMANNVKKSGSDDADWQHMVTFGVSIGQQGNLDPSGQKPNPWPDVWLSDAYSNSSWTNSDGKQRIDDLWHASVNGHGSFVVATDTEKFATALSDALKAVDARTASGSNVSSSSTKTATTTLTFEAGFTSSSWWGEVLASPFNAAMTGVSDTPIWKLSQTFGSGGVNQAYASRTVLTSKGGSASTFGTSMVGASDLAARTGQADEVSAADNIAYLKGDQSKEIGKPNGTLRKRVYPMGDIVDSSPAYSADSNTLFIGANDGMLHALDASTGKVLFSYVPKGLDFTSMATLSATAYEHRYFVDGQIDVISKSNQGNGKNVLVAALGRGGRGVFALDVTNPTTMGASNILWDNTTQDSTTEKDMGYVLGPIRIRKGNGGKTYAFVPNGVDSPNGSATLFVYQLDANGGIAATTRLVAASGGGNGLMSLGMADLNGDGLVDLVYGGDLKGNVWRWDFTGTTVPASATLLFQAKDAAGNTQPITGGLGVGIDPNSGALFVGFGTGRFLLSIDVPSVATQTTQTLYGIIDSATTITGRSQLQQRTIPYSGTTEKGDGGRGFENYSVLPNGKRGWYVDLPVPERVISAPTIYGSGMYISSIVPNTGASDCEGVAGSGYLNAINLFTGTSPQGTGYFTTGATLVNAGGQGGVLGSVAIGGGLPTEVNITTGLATVGTGGGPGERKNEGTPPPTGGLPTRVNWRELVPTQ